MAKAKASPPKKAKKSTAAKQVVTVLRRSPRKAVQSAKKVASEENIATGAPNRTVKSKPIAVAHATKRVTAPKVTISPSPKKAASSSAKASTPPSPKRGGPKKATKTVSSKSKTRAPSQSRISSRTRSQTPPEQPNVPAPDVRNEWTDSPKKRAPSKASTSKAVPKAASKRKSASQKVTKAGTGGIRKSIELPEANISHRPSSPARKTSISPIRRRSRITRNSKARSDSVVSDAGSKRAPSRSPARKTSNAAATALAFSRGSASPTKDEFAKPNKRGPTRSRSPAKAKQLATSNELGATVRSIRSRSKSPNKASKTLLRDGEAPPSISSPRPRGRPRSSSTVRPPSPLQVNKIRSSRSPAKASANGTRRSRSASPQKPKSGAAALRRGSSPSPVRDRKRATSPSKTQAQIDDEYDMAMQDIEEMAYSGDLNGAGNAHSSLTGPNQRLEAMKKGVERAELQRKLRAKGGLSKEQLRRAQSAKLYEFQETTNGLEDTSDELSSSEDSITRPKGPRHSALTARVGWPKRANGSRERRRSSANNQLSPKRSPSKSRPSGSSRTSEDEGPLQAGQPSEKGRGTVHSVTNKPLIPGTNRKNPFFETMPGPEVWHRRMPRFLPFGETPFMGKEMSRQISEDLAKGAEKPNQGWFAALNPFGKAKIPASEQHTHASPWALPDVEEPEVNAAMRQVAKVIGSDAPLTSPKRKASEQLSRRPVKKARHRSQGDEPRMSGALQ